jgi:hypothetical protein
LLRERVANNVAVAGEQQMNDLAYHQNIVVTVPGNTRFYIVLAKPPAARALAPAPAVRFPPAIQAGFRATLTPPRPVCKNCGNCWN